MANEVNIIKAQTSVADRRRNTIIDRKRVAAYCRVSTDGEEQLSSYRSQVKYYTELIEKNPDWMMAGIYADEAITGTQVTKREGFQKMILDCMAGQIDMVITKSISRFARNTLDTLKYVRMLKEKDIAVFFEDEKINTLSMDGELLLVVLSSVAQQEVENISTNVKKGLAMKMSRGEVIGFVGALGYDYDPQTKKMFINQEEAKIVQYIFNRYIEGMGSSVIARELDEKGIPSPKGANKWQQTTVMGIIKNEKYVGDLLQGKTFTVDPISKRRLENLGEADKYLLKDHHEAIISRETFEKAQEILRKRSHGKRNPLLKEDEYRTVYSRKFAFSCMLKCGFCGTTLSRRTWHTNNKYNKVIWLCTNASKNGKRYCPKCKAITEAAIKSAFLESYKIMTSDHKDVLDEFLHRMEETLHGKDTYKQVVKAKKQLQDLSYKLNNLLDMHLADKIDFQTYESKKQNLDKQIADKRLELKGLENLDGTENDMKKRIEAIRMHLEESHIMTEFDRQVFESIVDYVIIGGYDKEGNADPSMITFVYKTGFTDSKDGNKFKAKRMNASSKKLQSKTANEVSELQSKASLDAHRDGSALVTR